MTDPEGIARYDNASHQETGDLCARRFGPMSFGGGQANQAWGPKGQDYYAVQEEWSNASHGRVQAGP